MSRSSLPRFHGKRLRPGAAPRRRAAMRRSRLEPKPPRLAVPEDVFAALRERADGLCEIWAGAGCMGRGWVPHHRVTRKDGGRCSVAARKASDRLANLLLGCGWCHEEVHLIGRPAFDAGWRVRERRDPALVEVTYRGTPRWLDDVGGVHDYEAGAA
jgi:hypothetical protein